jgi:signal transduction histidine kinase
VTASPAWGDGREAPPSRPARWGRLQVELRLYGLFGTAWLFGIVHALVWAWLTLGLGGPIGDLPIAMLALPHMIAMGVAGVALYFDLPFIRWQGRARRLSPWPLLVLGFPMAIFAPILVTRDHRARAAPAPSEADVERTFQSLLRLPRTLGLRFLTWAALAGVVDVLVLARHADWTREAVVGMALLWIALLGPVAAIVGGLARAIVRPEYLTAPRSNQPFRQTADLRLRIVVSATIASAGSIIAPLCIGYLWVLAHSSEDDRIQAATRARELVTIAQRGDEAELVRAVEEPPEATVAVGSRRFGAQRRNLPASDGFFDSTDGSPPLAVLRGGSVTAAVPFTPLRGAPVPAFVVGALLIVAAAIAAAVLLGRSVRHDVVRASERIRTVVAGEKLVPALEGSFATLEIRELVGSVDRLVERITETNIGKYVAIEKAREVDRLKSQFLANMSHDLRSPLNSILGFSELLLSGIDGELLPEQREMIQTILDNGRSLLQEIDDILDTAKIEASRLELHPEPTPPATLITRAIQAAKKRQHADIRYAVDTAAGLPPAFCDPYRTVQAVENVLLFASERMEKGTIDIKLRLGKTDRGRMIFVQVFTPVRPASAEQLSRARRGFFRIPGHRGLGLGLPIAGSILELGGGALGIEDLEEGMVFSLQLCAPDARRVRPARVTEVKKTA